MIPYDIDPSLHSGEPVPPLLDDGFSPPPAYQPPPADTLQAEDGGDLTLASQAS